MRQIPFRDFAIPGAGSVYRWKIALALALTSFFFLITGILATSLTLRRLHRELPGYTLAVLVVFASPLLLAAIIQTPLYATLTGFGASALFTLFFIRSLTGCGRRDGLLAGAFLGLLVLVRLETGLIAVSIGTVLVLRREWRVLARLVAGSAWAPLAWALHNQVRFGNAFHLGMLSGDINVIGFDLRYIAENLFHPSCGFLIWSPMLAIGVAGLVLSKSTHLRALAAASVVMILLCLVRIPVMYFHMGETLDIGGIPIMSPPDWDAMRGLMRQDINRYLTVIAPFCVLGTRELLGLARRGWKLGKPVGGGDTRPGEP